MQKFRPFLFYFSYYAALAALAPYLALYYQSLGLSGTQIGLLTGLAPLITLISAPFWTGLADATRRHRLVMSLNVGSAVVLALLIPAAQNFFQLLVLVLVYAFGVAPVISFADSAALSMLADQPQLYGRVRMGGTLGWGSLALIVGAVLQRQGLVWSFYMYAAGMLITLAASQILVFRTSAGPGSLAQGVRQLAANPRWLLFLGLVFVAGMGMVAVNTYLLVYMQEVGASKSLMGLTLLVATLAELPVMFFGDRLLRRLKPRGLLLAAMAVIAVRSLLMAAFNAPLPLLLIQLLHGFTFPALWIAGVSYAHEQAPPNLHATAQGLFSALHSGSGAGLGGFIGGLFLQHWGGRGLFLAMGLIVLAGLLAYLIAERQWIGRAAPPGDPD